MKNNKRKNKKKTWTLIFLCTALAFVSAALIISLPSFKLSVNLPSTTIEYKAKYKDNGAQVFIGNKNTGKTVLGKGDVDTEKLGEYKVKYEAKFFWRKAEAVRTVKVVDTQKPIITLESTGKLTLPDHEYEEEGFKAYDNYDGDITSSVKREAVGNKVYYSVSDSSGNISKKERLVSYGDDIAPEIVLKGSKYITIYKGEIFKDPGFKTTDNYDGDITKLTKTEGKVNTLEVGTYNIKYLAADKAKNTVTAERFVTVIEKPNFKKVPANGKTIYLTFDDGPSQYTPKLLRILKKYNIKATFFVVGYGRREYLDDIVKDGHAIGIHTMTHNYSKLYSSDEAFMKEVKTQRREIKRLTGVDTTLLRFPGGSSNTVSKRYNKGIMTRLTKRVVSEGYQYFDWNVSSGDAGEVTTSKQVYYNVVKGVKQFDTSIVLQHDSKGFSVDAVEDIIRWGLSNGYTFKKLTPQSPTVHHPINN